MTKCRKPFGHLLTSFDVCERDVGGVNDCEIFLWILWTVGFNFWTSAHTKTKNHSKQVQTKISRSLTPPTSFPKMSKDVKRCQKGLRHFVISNADVNDVVTWPNRSSQSGLTRTRGPPRPSCRWHRCAPSLSCPSLLTCSAGGPASARIPCRLRPGV